MTHGFSCVHRGVVLWDRRRSQGMVVVFASFSTIITLMAGMITGGHTEVLATKRGEINGPALVTPKHLVSQTCL